MQSVNQHIEEQLMELTVHYVYVQSIDSVLLVISIMINVLHNLMQTMELVSIDKIASVKSRTNVNARRHFMEIIVKMKND
jgi:hypothetical protein